MKAQVLAAVIVSFAVHASHAQTPPTWNTPDARASALSKSPNAVNHVAATSNAVAATAGAAPKDRDCKSVVTRPEASYATAFTRWSTDGTEDHGQILNQVVGVTRVVQGDLDDLQVRIEQLRCEDQNIKAKLDYLIRVLVP